MRKKNWFDIHSDSISHSGHFVPYAMIIVGIIFIFRAPWNIDNSTVYKGQLERYSEDAMFLTIRSDSLNQETFKVDHRIYRKKLQSVLSKGKKIKIWTKKKNIKQVELDNCLVIKYNWWIETWFFVCFVVIGAILIPPIERSYRKWRREEDEKDMQFIYKAAARNNNIEKIMLKYNMKIKSCGLEFSDTSTFSYYSTENSYLSDCQICVRCKLSKESISRIELIYYTCRSNKTGDESLKTVCEYRYQINGSISNLSEIDPLITKYRHNGIKLKRCLNGNYKHFMELPEKCNQ
jgi:hypothetical protein